MAQNDRARIFWLEDDHPLVSRHSEALLQLYDVAVTAAKSDVFVSRRRPFDLLVLDIMIHAASTRAGAPECEAENISLGVQWREQGIAFLEHVRAGDFRQYGFPRGIPVVVFTAVIDRGTEDRVRKLGISEYLRKPARVDALLDAVRHALAENRAPGVGA